jgi:hypothetical protein
MGHIIPAGTGFSYHRKVALHPLVEMEDLPEPESAVPSLLTDTAEAESEPLVG